MKRLTGCVVLAALSASPAVVAERTQDPVQKGKRDAVLTRPAEVKRDRASGDYIVTYDRGDGESRDFVVSPATHVDPLIKAQVSGGSSGYTYQYTIRNGPLARQDIHSISLNVQLVPGTDVSQPVGWRPIKTPETSRLSWFKVPVQGTLDGVAPGSETSGFSIVSPLLPAPIEARCTGSVLPPKVPSDVPPAVASYLQRTLILRNNVIAWTIAPRISPGTNEPELTPEVLISRIQMEYARALERSNHPRKDEIAAALTEAATAFPQDARAGINALDRAQGLAVLASQDDWAKAIGGALAQCLDAVRRRFSL